MISASGSAYALITGASAGLGAEFARQLAAEGQHLILCARNVAALESLAESLHTQYGVDVHVFSADLSLSEGPGLLWQQIQAQSLQVDLLINNAGSAGGNLLEGDWSEHQAQLNLMTQSVAALCHYALPPMVARGQGKVINIASVVGRFAEVRESSYGPTKSYVVALSQGLAREVSAKGVQVMALCPGFTHTSFHESTDLKAMKDEMPQWLWYDAETVVREGLEASKQGKTLCISGRLYRWLDPLIRIAWIQRLLLKSF